jgi:hypothetical protein
MIFNVLLQYNFQVWQGFINVSESFSYKDSLFILAKQGKKEWRNARIFAGMSRTLNLVFDQIECIIRIKLDLMRNVLPTDENKRIQTAWRVNNINS